MLNGCPSNSTILNRPGCFSTPFGHDFVQIDLRMHTSGDDHGHDLHLVLWIFEKYREVLLSNTMQNFQIFRTTHSGLCDASKNSLWACFSKRGSRDNHLILSIPVESCHRWNNVGQLPTNEKASAV